MKKWDQTTMIDTAPEKVGGGRWSVAPDIVLLRSMPGVTLRTTQYAIPRSRKKEKLRPYITTHESLTTRTLTALVRL